MWRLQEKKKETTTTWVYPDRTATEVEKRIMLGRMAEIGVRTIFTNFCYTFGGQTFLQMAGGPIGARVTMAAARLVMQDWSEQYRQILNKADLNIRLFTGYVDDNRQGTSKLRKGTRFVKDENEFVHKKDWEDEDTEAGENDTVRMSKECLKAMNSVNKDLKFTVETTSDFKKNKLPTLDFEIWVENGVIKHSYYEKSMKTQLVIMRRSAMSERQKMDILSNEIIRRLSNIGEGLDQSEKIEVIDQYTRQLKNSEYGRCQIRDIIVSGLKGYLRKAERRKLAGERFYRKASETLKGRMKKKLTAKTTWFKKKRRKEIGKLGDRDSPRKKGRDRGENEKENDTGSSAKAVIYVPHTWGSLLAKEMREKEIEIEKLTGYKLKIVEKVGEPIERILVDNNPWSGQDC